MKIIRQMIRGCGTLPHVADHPGTDVLLILILLGGFAGRNGGITGILGGMAFMSIIYGPLYLYGAYERAEISDRMSKGEKTSEN